MNEKQKCWGCGKAYERTDDPIHDAHCSIACMQMDAQRLLDNWMIAGKTREYGIRAEMVHDELVYRSWIMRDDIKEEFGASYPALALWHCVNRLELELAHLG